MFKRNIFWVLLEYAKGKEAEELNDTIDKPLWEMFFKIRELGTKGHPIKKSDVKDK